MTTTPTKLHGAAAIVAQARTPSRTLRRVREGIVYSLLVASGLFSVLVTLAIVGVLSWETARFFGFFRATVDKHAESVSLTDYLFGIEWTPLLGGANKAFGMWPLVTGTLMVTVIAASVALPLGLIVAIYLSEYASTRVRAVLKPVLEVLAGIPTVVYGFFALTVITPALQWVAYNTTGSEIFANFNSTSAGIAVGIMCLPMVSSLSEDALRAVPRSLRDGAFAMGATKFDVATKVVTPAALSGIIASFLLAIARAVGETMIVALAAGGLAQMAFGPSAEGIVFRPHEGSQTMTAYMVQLFLGDAQFGSVEYYSAYVVGFTLFIMTLTLTIAGNWVLKRFREEYE
ncbi:MAG: phosphate ABC transporter permease subunit PstC [Planctomycetota bacterium]